jgi:NADH pyrophosphatase NudC (nudix superfamily)
VLDISSRPTHDTDIFVGDQDELAEVRWASLTEAEQLMQPYGMFGPVRDHLTNALR